MPDKDEVQSIPPPESIQPEEIFFVDIDTTANSRIEKGDSNEGMETKDKD